MGSAFGGGSQPTPPTLNVGQSAKLFERQLQLMNEYMPMFNTTALGNQSANTLYGLNMLTNPGRTLYGNQIGNLQNRLGDLRSELRAAQGGGGTEKNTSGGNSLLDMLGGGSGGGGANNDGRSVEAIRADIEAARQRLGNLQDRDPVADLTKALGPEFRQRDRLLDDLREAGRSSEEYKRMQRAFAEGIDAETTGRGALGSQLYREARQKMRDGGQLSAEAERDAVQAARAGMASRGMATGNAGLAAELLNRDRYSREREFQNLAFAQGVQTQDLARRQTNNAMQDATNRFNVGLLGQASAASGAERARQIGLGQDAYNFSLSTNPKMMLAGLGSPYANLTGNSMNMIAGARGLSPMYSGGSFSSPGIGGALGGIGAALGAGIGGVLAAPTGGLSVPMGMAIGGSFGGAAGGLGGSLFR